MKKLIVGALAHVDAGKTTLCEAILYKTNTIRTKGRVDHQDAFLDYDSQEKEKGITIFNKEARFSYKNKEYIYLDTPGHNELRSESNRAIKVIDVALLIINAAEDIPSDTISLFNNLLNYHLPIIIFVNKTDISYIDKEKILNNIKNKLSEKITSTNNLYEQVALENENLLDDFLNNSLDKNDVINAIYNNSVIPCLFGSALKDEGILELLDFIDEYTYLPKSKQDKLSAYIYKISNDNNEKLTHIKVLSGTLHNKEAFYNQKINEIRQYSGLSYTSVQEVNENDLCTVKGLNDLSIGTYLPSLINEEKDYSKSLSYELLFDGDLNDVYRKICVLNDELPNLKITLDNYHILINLNGDLEKEIIKRQIKDRFNIDVNFSDPVIRYKETILKETYGVGHFEPLRHYAEVIVSIKPIDDGLKIKSLVNNSYTGTILNYLRSYPIRGILTNSPLTNVEITIVDFKTHLKHTEGHDLIEAVNRAIRHALSKNEPILLEPYYLINIDTNQTIINSIISQLNDAKAIFTIEENSILSKVPYTTFNSFILSLRQKLRDNLSYEIIDTIYDEAINEKEIITNKAYDYLQDLRNPVGSIFTSHGAGHYVDKDEVEKMMHLKLSDYFENVEDVKVQRNHFSISEEELKRVWNSLYKPKERTYKKKVQEEDDAPRHIEIVYKPIMYIVDGYNLLYSIEDLKEISKDNFIMAREKIIDLVSDFKGYVNGELILVFDAYKQDYSKAQISDRDNITIVYTKAKETADTYIEKLSKELEDKYKVITVTSDYLEQLRVFSNSSLRLSSKEFLNRYESFKKQNLKQEITPINRPFKDLLKKLED